MGETKRMARAGATVSTGVKLGLGDPVHRLLLIRQRAL